MTWLKKIDWRKLSWLKWLIFGFHLLPVAYISFNEFGDYAWFVFLLATFVFLIAAGLKSKISFLKILFFNVSTVIFALLLYEGILGFKNLPLRQRPSLQKTESINGGGFVTDHPYLGYGSGTDGVYTSKETIDDKDVFDVSYTIRNGLRHTPNSNENSRNCALFFGCSYTFGEGVPDTATLPYFFNRSSGERYKVLNYGFQGYGPHQMLANIENRVFNDIKGCGADNIAIFSFAIFHVARAAGYSIWDQNGPKYEIIDGKLIKTGTFTNPNLPALQRKILEKIKKSFIYKRFFYERKTSDYDLARTVEIIKKSHELLLAGGVNLSVFVWDYDKDAFQSDFSLFIDEMKRNNIKTYYLHDAIRDFNEKEDNYILSRVDKHPGALANEKIAEYIYSQLNENK